MKIKLMPEFQRNVRERANKKLRAKLRKSKTLFEKNPYDPLLRNKALHHQWEGYRSFDVDDDYRVIFIEERRGYRFVAFGNHKELYRTWS
jgi:mRNA-degrading endonuclease YafQ of YafQ-DinJ toxin-antitoxin module